MGRGPHRVRCLAVVALAVGGAALAATTGPALAATDGSTDRSAVQAVTPSPEALDVVIERGDERLVVRVDAGHTLEIPGYQGERWVRIDADGTVSENVAALSAAANLDPGAAVPEPEEPLVEGDARWVVVGTDGSWSWHDHRIHDMGALASLGPGRLTTWEVPVVVDGDPVVITGTLDRLAAPSLLGWAGLAIACGGATWLAVRRRSVAAAAVPIAAAGALTGGVALAALLEELGTTAGPSLTTIGAVLLGFDAVAVAAVATVSARRGGRDPGTSWVRAGRLLLVAAGQVAVALVLQTASFTEPLLVTALPAVVDRTGLAVAAGLLFGATASLVWTGLGTATDPSPGLGPVS